MLVCINVNLQRFNNDFVVFGTDESFFKFMQVTSDKRDFSQTYYYITNFILIFTKVFFAIFFLVGSGRFSPICYHPCQVMIFNVMSFVKPPLSCFLRAISSWACSIRKAEVLAQRVDNFLQINQLFKRFHCVIIVSRIRPPLMNLTKQFAGEILACWLKRQHVKLLRHPDTFHDFVAN